MRSVMSATAVILALSATPSVARDYPWCGRTSGNGFEGGCNFTSFEQCRATVSGQAGTCQRNPRFLFGEQDRRPRRGSQYR